eukprot:CAMPEP_0194425540 /NCGR_PEP_ID=MMETSP0176-20130528/24818_1 /TAXON_ID=216777 /ORGANISM="Proboscia alata, Strain PI-D3" /LENGTH=55 /DNA_ID=CAMNT_0039235903 /DNA_START=13 /DNA_END=180 /DNA_ORIENTATION=+
MYPVQNDRMAWTPSCHQSGWLSSLLWGMCGRDQSKHPKPGRRVVEWTMLPMQDAA